MNKEEVKQWLDEHNVKSYKINEDLSIDVIGNVNLSKKNFTHIPVKFNIVKGNVDCSHNMLTDILFAPIKVNYFDCSQNKIVSLKGAPQCVEATFKCNNNKLLSLEHAPEIINLDFYCSYNPLVELGNLMTQVGRMFIFEAQDKYKIKGLEKYYDFRKSVRLTNKEFQQVLAKIKNQ